LALLVENLPLAVGSDPERVQDIVERLGAEVRRMAKMTDALIQLLSIEDFRHLATVPLTRLDLSPLTAELAASMAPLAAAKEQVLVVDTPGGAFVLGNDTNLQAIVGSLLENAIAYTPVGGRICVATEVVADRVGKKYVTLTVADDGVGIALEDQTRIFERFFRVDKARSRKTGGTGLGLSITMQAVQQHGGTVEVESRPGEGATFTVRLPYAR